MAYFGSSPEVLVDSACVPVTNECVALTDFASGQTAATPEAAGLSGTVSGKKYDFVTVAQRVHLAKPTGAYRSDDGLVDAAAAVYASPSGEAVTAHTSLTGNLVAPDAATGALYIVATVKAA